MKRLLLVFLAACGTDTRSPQPPSMPLDTVHQRPSIDTTHAPIAQDTCRLELNAIQLGPNWANENELWHPPDSSKIERLYCKRGSFVLVTHLPNGPIDTFPFKD